LQLPESDTSHPRISIGNTLNTTIHCAAVFFMSALMSMIVEGQVVSGKGFLPDENGTNLDDPQASKAAQRQKVAPGTIIKDCTECPEMVVVPGGSFLMGADPFSNLTSPIESPQHRVQIQSFAIGKYEVTQEQWYAVMGSNPSQNKGRTLPVQQVTWNEVQQFIAKLNLKTGQKYRLPSEAEWEYAARAGTTTEWSFGNNVLRLGNYAWYDGNSGSKSQAVGQKLPNAFGLFDMQGNLWEWTQDCWHDNYAGAPTDGSAWTTGCTDNSRVLRGGSWNQPPADLRSARRFWYTPDDRFYIDFGFRLARDL
jgi:formylglycine-generating enzyme required for sulfatase activity